MVLENVKEMWTELPKTGKGKKKAKPVARDRFISKMFLRLVVLYLLKAYDVFSFKSVEDFW